MTLISYAQNFEDVLLWRALGHIKDGFYIDVGANDPVDHSVTKAFYDAGWRGINIEPLPAFHQIFEQQRPRDINLAIAAGASDGSITLFDVPSVNGWATPDAAVAEAHRGDGFTVTELTVPMRTLASVCAEHAPQEIHFLKVDVEGFEGDVLRGMDFARWRPWVLLIEATMPNSRITNHETWEALVTTQGYHYAWFDGLNRYYVADEHKELLERLSVQPNVFDAFISHHLDSAWKANEASQAANAVANERLEHASRSQWETEQRADKLAGQLRQVQAQATELRAAVQAMEAEQPGLQARLDESTAWGRDLEQRLLATLGSTSWRVTRPLRLLAAMARRIRTASPRAVARTQLRRIVVGVTGNEHLRRLLVPLMLRFPAQAARLSRLLSSIKQAPSTGTGEVHVPEELRALNPSARRVLLDLQRVRANAKRDKV